MYDTCAELLAGLKGMQKYFRIICCTNRFVKPTPLGYMDVCLVVGVKLDDGTEHVTEVQLQLKLMLEAKEKGHGYYEHIRKKLSNRVQQFVMDRLEGRTDESITVVDVGLEALDLMALRKDCRQFWLKMTCNIREANMNLEFELEFEFVLKLE